MGMPQSPQALQLKLNRAFIFAIPVLFSIILFLFFYLFYFKRRASSLSSVPILPTSSNSTSPNIHGHPPCQMGWDREIKDKLPIILFDEGLRKRDSQCCVCLGEFEIKEELLQVPLCKHVFHIECIHHWLHSNTTCPLCRSSVIPPTKLSNPPIATESESQEREGTDSNDNQLNIHSEQLQQQLDGMMVVSDIADVCRGQLVVRIEGSSMASTSLHSSERLSSWGSSNQEATVVHK